MVYNSFDALTAAVKGSAKRTVVLAAAHDRHALEAVLDAAKSGAADYLLVGRAGEIISIGRELGAEIDSDRIYDALDDISAAQKAVGLVRDAVGDFLMKGGMETATLLRAVLDKERGLRLDSTMSHVAILESPRYHKLVAVTDGGMIPYPDLSQKRLILLNALRLFRSLGYGCPKAAILAASETVNERMPETLDGKLLKEAAEAGDFGPCQVEGPISLDLSVSAESAAIKGYSSAVTGEADILLTPNITAGNLLSKAMIYMGGAKMAGCVVGAKAPVVLTSRGASAEEKYLSLLLCAAMTGSK